jgi:CRISPR-associated endonuclease/helicase Cas3
MATTASISRSGLSFSEQFKALTGFGPYPWQGKLFDLFIRGEFPPNINLPTGSGKTSIIPIWLLALTHQTNQAQALTIPRRIVWVVNRRVVVDQATEEAEQIREKLIDKNATPALDSVREGLRKLSLEREGAEPIAISTLRGEKEDNREWSIDPSRPAIIVGTVDMIGSRLLFSGYGDSRYWRAQHAGLLGQDALIINDEAHLTPAFAKLIEKIESIQSETIKPFRTIRLSATHPEKNCWPESLEADQKHPHFKKIYTAKKKLHIQTHPATKIESAIIELATQKGLGRTIVFVTEPDKAQKLALAISKKLGSRELDGRVLTLTGTMRGFERDKLVEKDEFQVFTAPERPNQDYWLVATSAGEVGVNISADQLITTADTLDHLLQRFGRLNRFGETEGVAYLLSAEKEKDPRKIAALKFLRENLQKSDDAYNISPEALFGLKLNDDACEEPPLVAPLHPWHIDVWSQSSLGLHPARPQVAPWLHGKEEKVPETHIAWREEVGILERLDESLITDDDREEILEKYRLLAHEQLREPTHKLVEKLAVLFSKQDYTVVVWRRKQDGTVDRISFPQITEEINLCKDPKDAIKELAYCQLILPPGCGKLEHGMFEPEWLAVPPNEYIPFDVSGVQLREDNAVFPEERASYIATPIDEKAWSLKRMGGRPDAVYEIEQLPEWNRSQLDKFAREHDWRFLLEVKPEREEKSSISDWRLVYFGPIYQKKTELKKLSVDQHNSEVTRLAGAIASKLNLPSQYLQALKTSGKLHDLGKKEPIWQKAAGNWDFKQNCPTEKEPVAKPIGIMKGRRLGGFRHEFASLLRANAELSTSGIDSDVLDLVLHLVASHHGYGRPCFQSKAFDKARSLWDQEKIALGAVKRFAALQKCYGAWGLAYLESILRAADGLASQSNPEQPRNG